MNIKHIIKIRFLQHFSNHSGQKLLFFIKATIFWCLIIQPCSFTLGDYIKIAIWWRDFLGVGNEQFFLAAGWDSPPLPSVSHKGLREGVGQSTPSGGNKARLRQGGYRMEEHNSGR